MNQKTQAKAAVPTRAAILGATGYVGGELLRLLAGHPQVRVTHATSERQAGRRVGEVFPALGAAGGLKLEALDPVRVRAEADVVLAALPHGRSGPVVGALLDAGLTVIDLGADHRLPDPEVYASVYGHHHPRPELAVRAVYGLVEFARDRIAKASLVAVPGCYPTAALLALLPLLTRGLIDPADGVVVDAKSGITGAGREARTESLYAEVAGGVRPYKVGAHRHQPEMAVHAEALSGRAVEVLFVPQVVPMARGILAAVYGRLADGIDPDGTVVRERVAEVYADAPFVEVLPAGAWPETRWVTGTNRAVLGVGADEATGKVVAMCAIDNLVKGAAGQAVQCLNLMLGLPETTGLPTVGSAA
jgi:N-acetyl-gamma-glutamyl-phosphate reductase